MTQTFERKRHRQRWDGREGREATDFLAHEACRNRAGSHGIRKVDVRSAARGGKFALEELAIGDADRFIRPGGSAYGAAATGGHERQSTECEAKTARHSSPCTRRVQILFALSVGTPAVLRAMASRITSYSRITRARCGI